MQPAGKRYVQYGSRSDVFTVWGLGDLHMGHMGCDEKSIDRDIKDIKDDPFSLWIGLGDYGDYITPRDKRWHPGSTTAEAMANIGRYGTYMRDKVHDKFEPIADKCLGMLIGNHEDKYFQQTDQEDAHAWVCQELGVANLRYSSIFDVV